MSDIELFFSTFRASLLVETALYGLFVVLGIKYLSKRALLFYGFVLMWFGISLNIVRIANLPGMGMGGLGYFFIGLPSLFFSGIFLLMGGILLLMQVYKIVINKKLNKLDLMGSSKLWLGFVFLGFIALMIIYIKILKLSILDDIQWAFWRIIGNIFRIY